MNKIILKASAGTGKTYRLSIEFIAELLKGTAYDEILVLTFTKKATGEIRERVLEFIEKIIYKNETELIKSVEEKLGKSFDIEFLKNIYVQMIKNKEALKIYTIDSFIHQIFKKVIGPKLNIYNFDIVDDQKNSEYLQRVLDEILRDKKHFAQLKEFFLDNKEKKVSFYQKFINSFTSQDFDSMFHFILRNVMFSSQVVEAMKKLYKYESFLKEMTRVARKDVGILKVYFPEASDIFLF
jgi:ATP-dependent exoDNAse (exonuclease V) beta subunit